MGCLGKVERRAALWARADEINDLVRKVAEARARMSPEDPRRDLLLARQEQLVAESDRILADLARLYEGA